MERLPSSMAASTSMSLAHQPKLIHQAGRLALQCSEAARRPRVLGSLVAFGTVQHPRLPRCTSTLAGFKAC